MEHETAGDPITGLKWTHRTTEKIADELKKANINVSPNTVGKLLKEMGYSLRINCKKLYRSSYTREERDKQFQYISRQRKNFAGKGCMIVSVDTKKKEKVGPFKNPGKTWTQSPVPVNIYDFQTQAEGIAIPYGVYDILNNRGSVFVGISHDTPDFSTDCLVKWYTDEGCRRFPEATEMLVLAD